jgi:heme/copper-type cytochrome/quinol oxidase subunit 2
MRRTAFVLSLVMLCAVNAASGAVLWRGSGSAIEIELLQDVTGETPGAQYQITLDAPEGYVVNMLSVPEEMTTSIKVSDDTGNLVAETETSAPGEITQLRFDITDPGTYFVEISEVDGKDCGTYTFEVYKYFAGISKGLEPR